MTLVTRLAAYSLLFMTGPKYSPRFLPLSLVIDILCSAARILLA